MYLMIVFYIVQVSMWIPCVNLIIVQFVLTYSKYVRLCV